MIEQAVLDFLGALGPELRREAVFPFDSEERRDWHYIPKARNGVPLKTMNEAQRGAAKALLRAGLSERGYSGPRTSCGWRTSWPRSSAIPRPTAR